MLKVRENVPAPSPEPLSSAAISQVFQRIRNELQLLPTGSVPAASQGQADRLAALAEQRLQHRSGLQATGFAFASDADYQAI